MNGDFGQTAKDQNMCRSYKRLQHFVKRGLNLRTVKVIFTKSTISEGLSNVP